MHAAVCKLEVLDFGEKTSYVILVGGHAKCLRLMTRGEGGGSKIPKTCLRNTWMFPKHCVQVWVKIYKVMLELEN